MCGIYGFVTTTPHAASEILSALKILEYRGYDSWGIAVKTSSSNLKLRRHEMASPLGGKTQNGKLLVEKHIGKIGNAQTTLPKNSLAIGHTRWATHGGVTVENAHPHLDCTGTLALVHNGIFENYQEIKVKLLKRKHAFISETDSEVIIHLIEENLKNKGFATAVRDAFNEIHGLNAIVVLNSKSTEIIACKNGSPLIIGIGNDDYYISSDSSALPATIKQISILEDNHMAILGKSFKLLSLPNGNEVKPQFEAIKINENLNSKGKFRHFLLKEIYDQPEIISNIPKKSKNDVKKLSNYIKKAKGTFLLGCGTASYAALAGEYLFSKIAKHHVNFSTGSEFKYIQDFINKKSLIIPISQSGETIDVVEPVQQAKQKGAIVTPIVNVESSTLARLGNFFLPLHSGQEKAVVGTKSFTTMVGLLLLTAYDLIGKFSYGQNLLEQSSKDILNILKPASISSIKKLSKKLSKKEHIFAIGRGLSYVAAIEAALKLKETALIHAEGFAGGELKHGVIALIEKGTPCIVFAPNDETYNDIISNAQEIKARGGYIIGIGPIKNAVFDEYIKTGDLAEATLISQIVVMQLLAYYLALDRGIEDPDKPRNLAKSVTVK